MSLGSLNRLPSGCPYLSLLVEVAVLVAVRNEDQEVRQGASLTSFLPSFCLLG